MATSQHMTNKMIRQQQLKTELGQLSMLDDDDPHFSWQCEFCGANVPPVKIRMNDERVMRWAKPFCDCTAGRMAYEAKISQQDKQAHQQKAVQMLQDGGMNPLQGDMQGYSIPAWKPEKAGIANAGTKKATVERYCAEIFVGSPTTILILCGDYGTGKTHLAVGVARRLTLGKLIRPQYILWSDFMERIQASWGGKSDGAKLEMELLDKSKVRGILIIDDLDKIRPAEWNLRYLFNIIDHRCKLNLPTVITSNTMFNDWESYLSKGDEDKAKAIISRITGKLWGVVSFQGSDYRKAARGVS